MKMFGGAEILAVWVRGALKNRWRQGESGVKSRNKTKGVITCDAGIPAGNFPSNHAFHSARRMNQARNMHTATNLCIKMAAPGWPFSCNTGIKVVFRPLLWVVLSRSLTWKLWNLPLSCFVYEEIDFFFYFFIQDIYYYNYKELLKKKIITKF